MNTLTLDIVLSQAQQLTPIDQTRLINALLRTASVEQLHWIGASKIDDDDDDDAAEQRETWAYLQRTLDEDRLSDRPLFLKIFNHEPLHCA